MATWTAIPDTNLQPDKPARSIDALALRDNPIAISEGAAGAPRVVFGAMASPVAGDNFIIFYGTGDEIQDGEREVLVTNAVRNPGTVRMTADVMDIGGGNTVNVNFYKNGSIINTQSTTSATYVTFTHDTSVDIGDQLRIYISSNALTDFLARKCHIKSQVDTILTY